MSCDLEPRHDADCEWNATSKPHWCMCAEREHLEGLFVRQEKPIEEVVIRKDELADRITGRLFKKGYLFLYAHDNEIIVKNRCRSACIEVLNEILP